MTVFEPLSGLDVLVVHGHDGSSYQVSVPTRGVGKTMRIVHALGALRIQREVERLAIQQRHVDAIFPHVNALALHQLGVIQYEAKLGSEMSPIWAANQSTYLAIVEAIIRDFEALDNR